MKRSQDHRSSDKIPPTRSLSQRDREITNNVNYHTFHSSKSPMHSSDSNIRLQHIIIISRIFYWDNVDKWYLKYVFIVWIYSNLLAPDITEFSDFTLTALTYFRVNHGDQLFFFNLESS